MIEIRKFCNINYNPKIINNCNLKILRYKLKSDNDNINKGDLVVEIKKLEHRVKLVVKLKVIEYKKAFSIFIFLHYLLNLFYPLYLRCNYELSKLLYNYTCYIFILVI